MFCDSLCHIKHFHTICAPTAKGCSVPGSAFCFSIVNRSQWRWINYKTCLWLEIYRASACPVNLSVLLTSHGLSREWVQPRRQANTQTSIRGIWLLHWYHFLLTTELICQKKRNSISNEGRGQVTDRQSCISLALAIEVHYTLKKVKIFLTRKTKIAHLLIFILKTDFVRTTYF